jgi:Protein of unknown function (DUF2909)
VSDGSWWRVLRVLACFVVFTNARRNARITFDVRRATWGQGHRISGISCVQITDAPYNSFMRWLVILCLVAIVISMASALYFMYRDGTKDGAGGNRMFKALALRVGLSVGLFVFLMVAYKLGYIGPKGVSS